MKKKLIVALAVGLALSLVGCGKKEQETAQNEGFSPKLDTDSSATVEIAGFMGNFEALDQVMNAFNEIYPNVTFTYDHNTAFMLPDYLNNNASVDIFMTEDNNLKQEENADYYAADYCLDLSKEDLDVR